MLDTLQHDGCYGHVLQDSHIHTGDGKQNFYSFHIFIFHCLHERRVSTPISVVPIYSFISIEQSEKKQVVVSSAPLQSVSLPIQV